MNISKAAAGFLTGACVAVAVAGGAYQAMRSGESTLPAQQSEAALGTSSGPVEQSEEIVTDTPARAVPDAPAAARRAAVPKPVEQPGERRPSVARPPAPIIETPPPVAPVEPPRNEALPPPVASVEPPRIVDNQASRTVEPVGPVYDELVVAADSVIGLEIETALTSERALLEDAVVARVTRDVRVGNRVAIPAGSRVHGEVTTVERGGKVKDRARLGVRFTSIVLADGTRVPIVTETIYREGDSPVNESAAKIGGGAIGGAIIGAILGGGKGAAIGGAVGAGAGSGAVMVGGRNAATLPAGTPVTVRVQGPVVVTVER